MVRCDRKEDFQGREEGSVYFVVRQIGKGGSRRYRYIVVSRDVLDEWHNLPMLSNGSNDSTGL